MIIYICRAYGSEKSYFGKKLQVALKNKVIVIDIDNLLELFITPFSLKNGQLNHGTHIMHA